MLILLIFKVLILNNMHDAADFGTPSIDIFKNHKISMIRIQTLQYAVERSVLAFLAAFVFFFLDSSHSNHL